MNQNVNKFNQPIGDPLPQWEKSAYPSTLYAVGSDTIVTRLSLTHAKDLFAAYQQSHPGNWTYLMDEPPLSYELFEQSLVEKIENTGMVFYAVVQKKTNQALGIFALMRIDQGNGVIEVGNINFSDALRKTKMSTEAHYLLARYIFEELGYRRYEWKCDSLNAPSLQTAKRLGFQYEGTFRNALIYKNRSRNTSWFSMLLEEWPLHKKAFEQWLNEKNFDAQGIQIKRLEAFRR